MENKRILDHPILGPINNDQEVTFTFNDQSYKGINGDTIASALLANSVRILRYQEESGAVRGFYCNIGHCFECRVNVNNVEAVRACLTPIQKGMEIKSMKQLPRPFSNEEGAYE
jgi:sarcosine oxidase subunit alpha